MYDLKKWIEDDERVIHELTSLLEHLDVPIGNMKILRHTVDSFMPVERIADE